MLLMALKIDSDVVFSKIWRQCCWWHLKLILTLFFLRFDVNVADFALNWFWRCPYLACLLTFNQAKNCCCLLSYTPRIDKAIRPWSCDWIYCLFPTKSARKCWFDARRYLFINSMLIVWIKTTKKVENSIMDSSFM